MTRIPMTKKASKPCFPARGDQLDNPALSEAKNYRAAMALPGTG